MSLKKRLKSAVRRVGPTYARAVAYAAPVAGSLIGGSAGAAIGTGVGAAAGAVFSGGNRVARRKAAIRALKIGGAVTAGTAALGVVSGSGLGASPISSLSNLFGGAGAPVGTAGSKTWDPVRGEFVSNAAPSFVPQTSATPGAAPFAGLFGGGFGGATPGAQGGDITGGEGRGTDILSGTPQATDQFGTTLGGAGMTADGGSNNWILIGGAALAAFFLIKRKG